MRREGEMRYLAHADLGLQIYHGRTQEITSRIYVLTYMARGVQLTIITRHSAPNQRLIPHTCLLSLMHLLYSAYGKL